MQPPVSQPDKTPSATAAEPSASPPLLFDSTLTQNAYDPAQADRTVKLPGVLFNRHFWRLGWSVLTFFGVSLLTLFEESRLSSEERRRTKAQSLRELLFKLGPTYIKLGQFLSVRRDILPLEVAEELALLQDKVPPFGLDQVRQTIESDLGGAPEALFNQFDPTPIASASIGQVHRVTLKDGSEAVIKVQRPGLASSFYRDLGLMRLLARLWAFFSGMANQFDLHLPEKTGAQPSNFTRTRPLDIESWMELSDEFGRVLFSEIDYLKEGRNADRLRKLVRPKPQIRVPRVHWKYTGRHVLTLEYIPGIKISQVDELRAGGLDPKEVGNMLVNCYLEQFVLTGFFHADPHAGNLAVDPEGRLIIYDFGMMGEISESYRRALLSCVMAVVRRDAEQVTKSLMELGIVTRSAPAEAVARAIGPFIDYYAGRDIMHLDFRNLEADIDHVVAERSFRLPANLAYLLRAGSSLEGIARTLKPDFSFVAAVKPVMTKWALLQGFDALAKNGHLLEFAQLTYKEIKASVKDTKISGNNGHKAQNGHKANNGDKVADQLKAAVADQRAKSSRSREEIPQRSSSQPDFNSDSEAGCLPCAQHKDETGTLGNRLGSARLWAFVYVAVSLSATIFLANVASFHYRQITLSIVIGNLVLGAIIIWKFTNLLKLNSQQPTEVEKKRGNGES